MKRILFLISLTVVILAACQPKSGAALTRSLVKDWIAAYEALNADKYMAFYADEAKYMDNGLENFRSVGAFSRKELNTDVHYIFEHKEISFKSKSFYVSQDGRFATIEGDYTNQDKTGTPVTVPMVAILEFSQGKIIQETDYYDGSPFTP
jgi:ketosteroid isomerase-like protein